MVGDYILDNASSEEGTVKEITIFYTKLLTIDNKLILIPNGSLSNSSITNYSHMDMRRIDLTVGVGYACLLYTSGLPMQQTDMPEVQEKSESVWQQADREPPIW